MTKSKKILLAELARRKNLEAGIWTLRDRAPYPRPLADIEADLQDLEDREGDPAPVVVAAQPKGEFMEAVRVWAKDQKFVLGKTVPSAKVALFVRTHRDRFPRISDGGVRATLSALGYSKS